MSFVTAQIPGHVRVMDETGGHVQGDIVTENKA